MSVFSASLKLPGEATGAAPMTPVPSPATVPVAPSAASTVEAFIVILFTAIAIMLAIRLRVFRPGGVLGPKRVPDAAPLWPLMVVALIGFMAWQFALGIYLGLRQNQLKAHGVNDAVQNIQAHLTPRDYGIISTIPPAFGAATMAVSLWLLFPGSLRWLGFTWKRWWGGARRGAVAFLIIAPVVTWTGQLLQLIYQRVHYQHPSEHELLKKLGETHGKVPAVMLCIGAVFMAPLLEELLFRGLLQTFLRHGLMRLTQLRRPAPVLLEAQEFVPAPEPMLLPPPPLSYATPPRLVAPAVEYRPRPWHGWVAIILTSLAFAMLHDPWMRPIIFVLSLGLGYVYERTGILWASMTVHLLFNLLNTVQYVLLMMP
jgi:membrane protease YdiL (CAAX protease family)